MKLVGAMQKFFAAIGRTVLDLLRENGRLAVFTIDAVTSFVRPPIYWSLMFKQIMRIGFFSLPVVGLTAFFTGAVLALQIYIGTARYGAEQFVPTVVLIGILRELGPVIAGLMVAGRVAAAIAAELGTMRVTEQIDALTALGTEPVQYLVVPRVTASIAMMPLLVMLGDAVGMYGGYLVAVQLMGANPVTYVENSFQFLEVSDVTSGIVKAAVFGLIFSLVACVRGYYTEGGAEGVGRSTTRAVVSGSLAVLFADFFLTKLLF